MSDKFPLTSHPIPIHEDTGTVGHELKYTVQNSGEGFIDVMCLDRDQVIAHAYMKKVTDEGVLSIRKSLGIDLGPFIYDGIDTYYTSVFVCGIYEGRGIGTHLLYKLFDVLVAESKPFNHLVRDASFGWAFAKALPMLRARMAESGYQSQEIASGKVSLHNSANEDPCKLINYSKP